MRTEIGFVEDEQGKPTERLTLRLEAETATEWTALRMFAMQTNMRTDQTSWSLNISAGPKP